jgi:hypothetical protein
MQKIESSVNGAAVKGNRDGVYAGYGAPRLSIGQRLFEG